MKNATPKNLQDLTEQLLTTPVKYARVEIPARIQDYLAQRFQYSYAKHRASPEVIKALDELWQILIYPEAMESHDSKGDDHV